MTLQPSDVSLWIVNFQRRAALRATIESWCASFDFDEINVLVNDPTITNNELDWEYPIKWWPNIFRSPWETGSIAWCWNMAMRHTFEFRDWCLMSQDDVVVTPGWHEKINGDFMTYVAPHGDVTQLQSLRGFNAVGWFDERFRAIGGPEADYLLRMLQLYPGQLSAHDEHAWQLRHNDVGLADYWSSAPKLGEIAQTRSNYNVKFAEAECFQRWVQKWGVGVDQLFINTVSLTQTRGDYAWHTWQRRPGWDEIDWYPAFTRRLTEVGRR